MSLLITYSSLTLLCTWRSEKLFCVVTLLFETRVGTVNPSAVVRGLKRALRGSAPNLPDDLQICRVGLLGPEWSDFAVVRAVHCLQLCTSVPAAFIC